jgi:hypothetical protein
MSLLDRVDLDSEQAGQAVAAGFDEGLDVDRHYLPAREAT